MTIREVLTWPNKGLRAVAAPIAEITPNVLKYAEDLLDTMKAYNAQGIAATQVGINLRMLAFKRSDGTPLVLINPVVSIPGDAETIKSTEGCLSFPGVSVKMERVNKLVVDATTIYGNEISLELEGMDAVAIQHELNHLDGIVMLDFVASELEKKLIVKRIAKVNKRLTMAKKKYVR